MYWNRRFAIVVGLVWAVLVASGFYLLAGISPQRGAPPARTNSSLAGGTTPVTY